MSISLAFDAVRAGPRALLLIHGHPFNRTMWRPQLEGLDYPGWRLVAPDLRGYGESAVVPGVSTFDDFTEDLARLLDALDIPRAVIGGLSMGGQIAMHFGLRYPERVSGLLLAATFAEPETPEGKANRRAMAERLVREGMEAYATDVLPKMVSPRSLAAMPDVGTHVLGMMRGTNPVGAAAALRGRAERPDYAPTLATLNVPALVVVGTDDAFTSRADAERICQLLPDAELLCVEGVGHMPNLEAAAEFNAGVRRLLDRVTIRD